jgi:hypothetical protein
MGTSIKCWSVSKNTQPVEAQPGNPELEEHFENWVEESVELIDPSLIIIGRQVQNIDLLAIDNEGQLVIIELKRDQLPRFVLAQALDYASMVATWTPEKIINLANEYLSKSIHDTFEERFGKSLEDTGGINSGQRIVLVGCRTDSTLDRMVSWLSEKDIPINVVTMSFFVLPDGQTILVRSVLVSEEEAKARGDVKKGRRSPLSEGEVRNLIVEHGLEELLASFKEWDTLPTLTKLPGLDGIDYEVRIPRSDGAPLRRKAIQFLLRGSKLGQLRIGIIANNLAEFLDITKDEILKALPDMKWNPHVNWRLESNLQNLDECRKLSESITQLLDKS